MNKKWKKLLREANDTKNVSKVVILNKNKEFLCIKRSDEPNNWDLPGGHVHEDEKSIDAAKRETKEETNLDVDDLDYLKTDKNTRFYSTSVVGTENIALDPDEHTEHTWVKLENLKDYNLIPSAKMAIKKLFKQLDEDFQDDVKRKHARLKKRNIGMGGNTKKEPPFSKKPSYKRSKSSPRGFGGA
jgi:8-oxo-dGTP diphosphatase